MKNEMPDIKITAFNDLFSTEEDRQAEKHGAIVNIRIAEIEIFIITLLRLKKMQICVPLKTA